MTDRSPELVRVLCAAPPTSWGVQHPDHAKSQRASFGVFEFSDMPSGAEFEFTWFYEGEPDASDSIMWTYESSGQTWVNIDNPDGLDAGVYELQLSVDGELLQTGSFAVESAPDEGADAQAWYDQGIELYEQGAHEEALAVFSQAIELVPDYVAACNSRALTLVELGDLDGALADLNQALELDASYAKAYNSRGEVYRIQGDLKRAIADFDQAIALAPDYALPYDNRGRAYRALDDLDQALELDPEDASAYFNRGTVYDIQEDGSALWPIMTRPSLSTPPIPSLISTVASPTILWAN